MKSRGISLLDISPKLRGQATTQILAQQKQPAAQKRSKFGNTRVPFESIQGFKLIAESMREARDYATLDIGIQAGLVIRWVPQVSFLLQGGSRYRCDAMVWWADGRVTVRDCKGFETPEFKLKRGLMMSTYKLEIEVVK